MVKIYTFFQTKVCDLNLSQKTSDFFNDFDHIFIDKHIFLTSLFNKFFIEIVFTMSLILSEYIEPFSACLIKSVCKIFYVKVTNTHCCSLAKNDPYLDTSFKTVLVFFNIAKYIVRKNNNEIIHLYISV